MSHAQIALWGPRRRLQRPPRTTAPAPPQGGLGRAPPPVGDPGPQEGEDVGRGRRRRGGLGPPAQGEGPDEGGAARGHEGQGP